MKRKPIKNTIISYIYSFLKQATFASILIFFIPSIILAFNYTSSTTYNGPAGYDDRAHAIVCDGSGNIYVAGYLDNNSDDNDGEGRDIWVAKYDSSLTLQNSVTFKGNNQTTTNRNDEAFGIDIDGSGNVYVAGYTTDISYKYIWIGKYNSSLVLQSSTSFHGPSIIAKAHDIHIEGSDIYVAGYLNTVEAGNYDMWIAKYDTSLVLQSSTTYTSADLDADIAYGITADGSNIYVTGGIDFYDNEHYDGWVGKFDSSLVLQSTAIFKPGGSFPNYDDVGRGITTDASGNVYVIGYLGDDGSVETEGMIKLLKYNSSLSLQNEISVEGYPVGYQFGVNRDDKGYGIACDTNGNIFTTGFIHWDDVKEIWAGVYDTSLVLKSSSTLSGEYSGYDEGRAVATDNNGSVYVTGYVYGAVGRQNVWIGRYDLGTSTPTGFAGEGVSAGSIKWSWDDQGFEEGYQVLSSTNGNFSGNLGVNTTSWIETGISTNTALTRKLTAYNSYGASTTTLLSVYSGAAEPGFSDFANVSGNSMQVNWTANTNPAGTTYYVVLSTGASPGTNGYSGNVSSYTTNTSVILGSLSTAKLYYSEVKALNHNGVSTAYINLGSTMTAIPPSGFAGTALGVSSITWSWNDSNIENSYQIISEINADISGVLGANTVTSTETGLSPNIQYQRKLVANYNLDSTTTSVVSKYTLANQPGSSSFTNVSPTILQANWTNNSNPGGTVYTVIISTVVSPGTNGASGNISSNTVNTSLLQKGLTENTTYYVDVKAENGNGVSTLYTNLGSTKTAYTPSNFQANIVNSSSVTWTWTDSDLENNYKIVDAFDADISGSIGSNFVGWVETGLGVNTLVRRKLVANYNLENSTTSIVETYTYAVKPATSAFSNIALTSLRANWDKNGNPNFTSYYIVLSTGATPSLNGYTGNQFKNTSNDTYMDFTGLTSNTTYYVEVKAINHGGVSTLYSAYEPVKTAYDPADFSGSAVGVSSITWAWTDGGSETGYRIITDTDANISGDLGANVISWTETGLSTNTAYSRRIVAIYGTELSTSSAVAKYTMVNVPQIADFTNVAPSSLRSHWLANTNPAGTIYNVQISSSSSPSTNGYSGNKSSTTTNIYADFSGLEGSTTYYVQVRAMNHNDIYSSYTNEVSTMTLPPQIGTPNATMIGISSITWTWDAISNVLYYKVYDATSSVLIDGNVLTNSYTRTNLSTNTAYGIYVTAVNNTGESSNSPNEIMYTLSANPTNFEFIGVYESSATMQWNSNTNPSSNTKYKLEYGVSGGSKTAVIFTETNAGFTNLLSGTTYEFVLRSMNGDEVLSSSVEISTVTVTDILASSVSVIDAEGGTVTIDTIYGEIKIEVPAGAFDELVSMTVRLKDTFADPESPTLKLEGTGIGIEITLDKDVQPGKDVIITLSYRDSDITSLDEGKLIISRYNEDYDIWVPLVSSIDPLTNKVIARTNHFSIFQMMQATPSDTLESVKVFPNPFRPAKGHAFVTFAKLPAESSIKIYTLTGELVSELITDSVGMVNWDVTNDSGEKVASGVYFVLLESQDAKKVIKVAVQR